MGLFGRRKPQWVEFIAVEAEPLPFRCAYDSGYASSGNKNVATQEGRIATTRIMNLPDYLPAECEGEIVATDAPYVRMTDTGSICVKATLQCAREDCPAMDSGFFNRGLAESYVQIHATQAGSSLEDSANGPITAPPQTS